MAVRLSALRVGRPFAPRKIPGTQFCYRLSVPQDHCAAGSIRSIEKWNDLIGNRTRDLPACSIVPQPTTPPPSRTIVLGSTQPLTEMSTRNLIGGEGRPAHKAQNLTANCEPIV
jgi:hypothetical protein